MMRRMKKKRGEGRGVRGGGEEGNPSLPFDIRMLIFIVVTILTTLTISTHRRKLTGTHERNPNYEK